MREEEEREYKGMMAGERERKGVGKTQ